MFKKLFSPICLTFSCLLFLYILYKSEFYFALTITDYYLIYFFISIILIIFSILTFFLNEKIKEYIIISTASIIVGLYLFEGYLTFKSEFNLKTVQKIYKKETREEYDTRTLRKIYSDLIKTNNNVVVTVGQRNHISTDNKLLPLSGISHSKTIYCNENGYYSIYESDRYGFNNPDKEWDKKKIDYLLIGDSFVHGACVNRPNDIASILRNISGKSALNLGYAGNGPLTEYAILREYLHSNVKNIVWFYFEGNDMRDLKVELNNKILNNYINNLTFSQNLKKKVAQTNKLSSMLIAEVFKKEEDAIKRMEEENKKLFLKFINFVKIYNTRLLFVKRKTSKLLIPSPLPEFGQILSLTKELATKNNSKLYFVYLPIIHKNNVYNNSLEEIKKIVIDLNIPFIDIKTEVFDKESNPIRLLPFHGKRGGHYNIEGYKKIANIIYNKLDK